MTKLFVGLVFVILIILIGIYSTFLIMDKKEPELWRTKYLEHVEEKNRKYGDYYGHTIHTVKQAIVFLCILLYVCILAF